MFFTYPNRRSPRYKFLGSFSVHPMVTNFLVFCFSGQFNRLILSKQNCFDWQINCTPIRRTHKFVINGFSLKQVGLHPLTVHTNTRKKKKCSCQWEHSLTPCEIWNGGFWNQQSAQTVLCGISVICFGLCFR